MVIDVFRWILFSYLFILVIVFYTEYFTGVNEKYYDGAFSKRMECLLIAILWPVVFYLYVRQFYRYLIVLFILYKTKWKIKDREVKEDLKEIIKVIKLKRW